MDVRTEISSRVALACVDDDRVLTFEEWCALNSFSPSTGYRLVANGQGPTFIRLSARRKGVTVGENRRWLASRQTAA